MKFKFIIKLINVLVIFCWMFCSYAPAQNLLTLSELIDKGLEENPSVQGQ